MVSRYSRLSAGISRLLWKVKEAMPMTENEITRVHYFDQQFLRKQEFEVEQAYHLHMRRRHNIAHHTWGIVFGLKLVMEENVPLVTPGLAVDGYGREIILAQTQPLPTALFDEKDSDVLDVWILYDRVGSDNAPAGYASCQNGSEADYYRWQERPLLYLDVPDPAYPDRRQPKRVPPGEWQFPPHQNAPDDAQKDWPVFLGQIHREGDAPEFEYTTVSGDRPYAGLRGEQITSPSGRARVQIGAEDANDERRFAVSTWDIEAGGRAERLRIDQEGRVDLYQKVKVHGDVTLAGGAVEFGVCQTNSDPTRPWRIYRYDQNELRIAMDKGAPAGTNAVVIGFWSAEDEVFVPCLTITDDRNVQIHGNLIVQGNIQATTISADVPLDSEATGLTMAAMLSGVGGASALLGQVYRSPYGSDLEIVARLLDDETGRVAVAGVLLESPVRAENFLGVVLGEAAGRAALLAALADSDTRFRNFMGVVLDSDDGRTAIIDSLKGDLGRSEIFTAALVASDTLRVAVVVNLLKAEAGRQAIVQNLATSPELNSFMDQLAANSDTRAAAALSLLNRTDGRQAIVVTLATDVTTSDLNDFSNRLAANQTTRESMIGSLLEIPQARASVADGLLDGSSGRRAIAESMNTVSARVTDFAALLKDEFPTLASELAAALTED
jgi:hypothetical protein